MDKTPEGREVLDFDPNNLPLDHLAAIGLMTASAASTDSIIEMAIAGALGLDMEQGYAVTCHMSALHRLSVLKAATEIRFSDPKVLDLLDEIVAKIDAAAKDRNDLIHGSMARIPSREQVMLVQERARTHVEVTIRELKVDDIKAKAKALHDAGMELMQFMMDTNILPAFPRERARGVNTPKARKAARMHAEAAVDAIDDSMTPPA